MSNVEKSIVLCDWCKNPCDGNFHHMECYTGFYKVKYPDALDAQFCQISFGTLVMLNSAKSSTAEVDWSQIEIRSHPIQKQKMNASIVWHRKDKSDALGLLTRFWKTVKWTTDENICPSILWVISDGKVKQIIGLECYGAKGSETAKWAMTHPIQGTRVVSAVDRMYQ